MTWILISYTVFAAALVLTLLIIPVCRKVADKLDFMDIPRCEMHKAHKTPTPLLGGAGMFAAWVIVFCAAMAGSALIPSESFAPHILKQFAGITYISREIFVLLGCTLGAVLLGTYDDRHSMKAWKKLIGQIILALCTTLWGGVRITLFISCPVISIAVTVFWFVFIFNAINFFDNMDGLAAGTATIAFLFFTIAAGVNAQYFIMVLGALSAGAALGFWFYNKAPAKIFMGDGGSHFLAYLLAFISARITYYTPGVSATRLNLLIPLFILAIPLLDALTVIVIRIHNHKPIYIGDNNHISHRFQHMGMTRPSAVLMVHLLCLISGLGALPMLWGDVRTSTILIVQGLIIYLLVLLIQYTIAKGDSK